MSKGRVFRISVSTKNKIQATYHIRHTWKKLRKKNAVLSSHLWAPRSSAHLQIHRQSPSLCPTFLINKYWLNHFSCLYGVYIYMFPVPPRRVLHRLVLCSLHAFCRPSPQLHNVCVCSLSSFVFFPPIKPCYLLVLSATFTDRWVIRWGRRTQYVILLEKQCAVTSSTSVDNSHCTALAHVGHSFLSRAQVFFVYLQIFYSIFSPDKKKKPFPLRFKCVS